MTKTEVTASSLKPTIKPFQNMTHHNDGTVSFFNTLLDKWVRGDVNAYLAEVRATKRNKAGA